MTVSRQPSKTGRQERGKLLRLPSRRRGLDSPSSNTGVTLAGDRAGGASNDSSLPVPEPVEHVIRPEERAETARSEQPPSQITAWWFRSGVEPVQVTIDQVSHLITDSANFVWVDLSAYTLEDLQFVGRLLGLHRQVLHAIQSPWHRPMLILYPEYFFVSVTVPRLDPSAYRIHAGELDLIVGHNVLVSAHKLPLPFDERILTRAWHSPDLVQLDSAYMLYIVLDELIAYYEELNSQLQGEVEQVEERALHQTSDAFLEQLLHFKRYAFALAQLADQHREIFVAFLRPDFSWVAGGDVEAYFRDLEHRLAHLLDRLREAKEAINGAFEIYVSHMTHRTNQIIKVLTLVSTILLPATVIIGLFGTNLSSIFQRSSFTTPLEFIAMLLAILLVSGGILWGFRRRGWV